MRTVTSPGRALGRALRAARAAALLAPLAARGLAQAPAPPPAQPPAAEIRVRAGTSVAPDTVTVGDPIVVQLRVQAPVGAAVTFPEGPDSAATVALLDPRRVTKQPAADAAGFEDHLAVYRLAAWDVGAQPIPLGDVVVRVGAAERRVPVGALGVFVRSVLPADSALR